MAEIIHETEIFNQGVMLSEVPEGTGRMGVSAHKTHPVVLFSIVDGSRHASIALAPREVIAAHKYLTDWLLEFGDGAFS